MAREGFDDVLFPVAVSLGARGGPERRTEITQLASGAEVRRARWEQSLRRWNVAGGVRSFADAETVLAFFEAREGRRFAFAFRDPVDHRSSPSGLEITPQDQVIGEGDGAATMFHLYKAYGGISRKIDLARASTLRVAIDGAELDPSEFTLHTDRDRIDFTVPPPLGSVVTAGFEFDVPVRFDNDQLVLELGAKGASFPDITLIEVRL